jgi:hypothetical protein
VGAAETTEDKIKATVTALVNILLVDSMEFTFGCWRVEYLEVRIEEELVS